LETRVANIVAN